MNSDLARNTIAAWAADPNACDELDITDRWYLQWIDDDRFELRYRGPRFGSAVIDRLTADELIDLAQSILSVKEYE